MKKPIIAVHLGDMCGIGPEIAVKACFNKEIIDNCKPLIVGNEKTLKLGQNIANLKLNYKKIKSVDEIDFINYPVNLLETSEIDELPNLGEYSEVAGKLAGDYLMQILKLCKEKSVDGFVFAPFNKTSLKMGGYKVESENKLFAKFFECQDHVSEMNVIEDTWTSRVTSHIPIKEVSEFLTEDSIFGAIYQAHQTLKRAGYQSPRIGVSALNPHAGENGTCGREEIDIIAKAVSRAKSQGIDIEGPISADIIFIKALQKKEFDAVVTMYHDQGQIALKLVGFDSGVTVHAGLPIPITTPAHGSAFDIAGKNLAGTGAIENAFKMAIKMAK